MSQRALDLRRSTQIVRRHKVFLAVMVALGILGGAAYTVTTPPMLTSTALVALLQSAQSAQAATTTTGGTDSFTQTQEAAAGSTSVLLDALPHVRPAMS